MNRNFPLFETLFNDQDKKIVKDLHRTDKEFYVQNISQLEDTHEIIYALIVAYFIKTEQNIITSTIPYGGQFIESGVVQFNYNTFPPKLKRMLFHFVKMHLQNA
jgi:hypothetical protein